MEQALERVSETTTAPAAHLAEHGYAVVRGVFPKSVTRAAREAWASEMKPHQGFVYRQATGNPERNVIGDHGFVMNPVLNLQSLSGRLFPALRQAALAVFTDKKLRSVLASIMGEPKLVQSMYFEGNPATWAHQDTYYLDSENVGAMVGVWIALEDIPEGAGRFYVYPGSHKIDVARNGGDFDIAFNHDRYKELAAKLVKDMECVAPALNEGDVLLWDSRTMHGSLATLTPQHSRSSITAHFIPATDRLLQFQRRIKPLKIETHDGLLIHCPKNQNKLVNRAILFVETRFAKPFQFAKRLAVKALVR